MSTLVVVLVVVLMTGGFALAFGHYMNVADTEVRDLA